MKKNKKRSSTGVHPEGLKITNICIALVVLGLLILVMVMHSIYSFASRYEGLIRATDMRQNIEEDILMLENGREYLDARAKEAVVQKTAMKMLDYSEEFNETRRIQNAVSDIENCVGDSREGKETRRYFEETLKKQDALIDRQLHAMKLIAVMKGLDSDSVPPEIDAYELTEEELAYSPEQMYDAAFALLYEDKYFRTQESMDKKLTLAENSVKKYVAEVQNSSKKAYESEIRRIFILVCISSFIIAVTILFVFFMVVVPLRRFNRNIKDDCHLDNVGAYEFKYLAHIYNDIYDKNKIARLQLEHKADHDGLTGLLNRQAFNSLMEHYRNTDGNMAVMIVDVDHFKAVNDTSGHEIGDMALKKVAALLEDHFRATDHFIRYGGDEFVVIMSDTDESQKTGIAERIDDINRILQNPENTDMPKLSVSAGIAFSDDGFTDDLFNRADSALYNRKKNGRCGYSFG